jgi:hypothetical protein
MFWWPGNPAGNYGRLVLGSSLITAFFLLSLGTELGLEAVFWAIKFPLNYLLLIVEMTVITVSDLVSVCCGVGYLFLYATFFGLTITTHLLSTATSKLEIFQHVWHDGSLRALIATSLCWFYRERQRVSSALIKITREFTYHLATRKEFWIYRCAGPSGVDTRHTAIPKHQISDWNRCVPCVELRFILVSFPRFLLHVVLSLVPMIFPHFHFLHTSSCRLSSDPRTRNPRLSNICFELGLATTNVLPPIFRYFIAVSCKPTSRASSLVVWVDRSPPFCLRDD